MEKLKQLRKKYNLTQQQLADKLNIQKKTYFNYENDLRQPDIEMLKKLADFFDVTIDEIVGHKKKDNELASLTLSKLQKEAINEILRLNDFNLSMVISYCKGLYVNQKEV